jgi:hypothetical protein
MLDWTLFVTNAPGTLISLKQVYDFYRIRWQIELIFKLWKSYGGLNQILAWRKECALTETLRQDDRDCACPFFTCTAPHPG